MLMLFIGILRMVVTSLSQKVLMIFFLYGEQLLNEVCLNT